jgi:pyruvate/2-oxoglutarate dehydrogenase complex dihydrolipoamide acyltransferase (E2) component
MTKQAVALVCYALLAIVFAVSTCCYFTPIINAPEVAIMGVCKSSTEPKWDGTQFAPRLMLPLSLSWDHRVIDGASAARFNVYYARAWPRL